MRLLEDKKDCILNKILAIKTKHGKGLSNRVDLLNVCDDSESDVGPSTPDGTESETLTACSSNSLALTSTSGAGLWLGDPP